MARNSSLVPGARGALNKFKFEVANEIGMGQAYASGGPWESDFQTERGCRWLYDQKDG